MRNDITIRPEKASEYAELNALVLRSFAEGTDYSDGTDVVAFVDEIRASEFYMPELSFVAELDGKAVGHFMFSKFPISATEKGGHGGAESTDILMLAPVAVSADFFRQGVGTAMLTLGIERVRALGFRAITVEGNDLFYNRFGFTTSADFGIYATSGLPLKEPRFMMCMELYEGALEYTRGYIVYDMYENA